MRKGRVRELLEAMLWDPRNEPREYKILFVSRGAPNDLEEVRGDEIRVVGDRIMLSDGREIPHHRIVAIWRGREILYVRRDPRERLGGGA